MYHMNIWQNLLLFSEEHCNLLRIINSSQRFFLRKDPSGYFYPPSLSESWAPSQGICLRYRGVFVTFSHFSSPPSIIYQHELHATRQVLESRVAFLHSPNHSSEYWSHEAQPLFPALGGQSPNTTAQTGPILFHWVQGHSSVARVKVIGWQPPASCIWMTDAPSVPLQNANARASFSLSFSASKGDPARPYMASVPLVGRRVTIYAKTIIEMQVIAALSSPAQPPTPPQLTLRISCLITFNATSENWSQTTSLVWSCCSSLVTCCSLILVCSQSMTLYHDIFRTPVTLSDDLSLLI